ncbi:MAG: F0F1 ATP synthase subunit B [Desulfovibrionales bacterium]
MKRLRLVGMVAAMLLLSVAVAWAAEGGEGGSGKLMDLVWRFVTFAIVVGLLWKLTASRLKEFFSGRTYQIKSELDDLETRKAEAEKRLKNVHASIANLEQERREILEGFEREGEKLKESIIAGAHEAAAKIREQAELTAAQEAKLAVEGLKAEMAEKIVQTAEQLIREKLSKDEHEKLVNEYLTKVVLN